MATAVTSDWRESFGDDDDEVTIEAVAALTGERIGSYCMSNKSRVSKLRTLISREALNCPYESVELIFDSNPLRDNTTLAMTELRNGGAIQVLRHEPLKVLSAGADARVLMWNVTDGSCLCEFAGHGSWVRSACLSKGGSLLVTASADATARIWRASDGRCLHVLEGHEGWVQSAQFSPDDSQVLSASEDGTARLWLVSDGSCVKIIDNSRVPLRSAAISKNGSLAVFACANGIAKLCSLEHQGNGWLRALQGHRSGLCLNAVAFSPEDKLVITASDDETARIWRVSDGICLHVLAGHGRHVCSACFSADGLLAFTASQDGQLRFWHVVDGSCVSFLEDARSYVYSAALSPDCLTVVVGGFDGVASILRVSDGEILSNLEGHRGAVNSVVFAA